MVAPRSSTSGLTLASCSASIVSSISCWSAECVSSSKSFCMIVSWYKSRIADFIVYTVAAGLRVRAAGLPRPNFGIDERDRIAAAKLDDIVECFAEVTLEHFLLDPRAMRGAQDIIHFEQRMLAFEHRLVFINVDRRVAWATVLKRSNEGPGCDDLRARGIDEQGSRFHQAKTLTRDRMAGLGS